MGRVVGPNFSHSPDYGPRGGNVGGLRAFIESFTGLVRQYGLKGVAALIFAAMFAFAPLTLLYWFNELRFQPVLSVQPGQRVIVKQARHEEEQERESPGETGLLQVVCDAESMNEVRPLLGDDDPRRDQSGFFSSIFVRDEKVYLRPAGLDPAPPFALLGKPPISVWLPAGDYEILVINEAPRAEARVDARSNSFPLLSTYAACSLQNREKTVCRVRLSHYSWGMGHLIGYADGGNLVIDRPPREEEIAELVKAFETATAIPTPAGYVLSLDEPTVHHSDDHRGCTIDFTERHSVPREWTRDQIALLRNWLPEEATAARDRLSGWVDALQWREFLEGWFCYAAAGVAGLVFTRWGAIAMLEPWRRGSSFGDAVALLVKIFFLSIAVWFAHHVLSDSSGCSSGPIPFRIR